MTNYYDETDETEIAELLVGRRIVAAEKGNFVIPGRSAWEDDNAEGKLVLDDGTVLYLAGNVGGCSCGAGDYQLEKLATVDNIITSARVESNPGGDDYLNDSYDDGAYRIFVVADAVEINVAEFVGSDGNGYYGTGFELHVVRPS